MRRLENGIAMASEGEGDLRELESELKLVAAGRVCREGKLYCKRRERKSFDGL